MMKCGKVSEAVLDRSVLRPLSGAGALAERGAAFGEDCAVLYHENERASIRCSTVTGMLGGTYDRTLWMFMGEAVNNLSAAGAEADSLVMDVLYPARAEEAGLKMLMREAGEACAKLGLKICGGHTEVEPMLRPAVTITAVGRADRCMYTGGLMPDQDLVMAGWAGLAGTAVLAQNREKELLKRYPFSLVDTAKAFEQHILIREAARAGIHFGVSSMHDVSQGGVFGALWEMAECGGTGLEVDLKKIPIRQETIEICEFFDLNPYQLYGQGALLLGTDRGEALASLLGAQGIPAAVIGHTNGGNDRIIRNGGEERFLDRPAQDMLWTPQQRQEDVGQTDRAYCGLF